MTGDLHSTLAALNKKHGDSEVTNLQAELTAMRNALK